MSPIELKYISKLPNKEMLAKDTYFLGPAFLSEVNMYNEKGAFFTERLSLFTVIG